VFIAGRGRDSSETGASVVADWSQMSPGGATVLDLGCGTGVPISQALIERGFKVLGWTPHPRWSQRSELAFQPSQLSVPLQRIRTSSVETFDGVVAWGLFFLLDTEGQRTLIAKVAAVLPRGGRFLFTAPGQSCSWPDAMTGRTSISLGHEAYRNAMEAEGMSLVGTHRGEGENHYYFA
jgi:cyclopropane fatty-acyl-phospholipid synthase-like methyltransferase